MAIQVLDSLGVSGWHGKLCLYSYQGSIYLVDSRRSALLHPSSFPNDSGDLSPDRWVLVKDVFANRCIPLPNVGDLTHLAFCCTKPLNTFRPISRSLWSLSATTVASRCMCLSSTTAPGHRRYIGVRFTKS